MTTPTPSDKIVDDLVWCGRQLYHYEQPIMVPLSPEGFAAFDRARRMIHDYRRDLAAAQKELAELMKWKEAVINELIVAHIYGQVHDDSPRKAVHDAITWNCQVALDPAVSSDAQRLRDTHLQRAEAAERRAEDSARDAKEAIAIAGLLFDAWEDGQPCYETDGESGMGASIGNAFRLSDEDFTRCTEFLNRVDPRGTAIAAKGEAG